MQGHHENENSKNGQRSEQLIGKIMSLSWFLSKSTEKELPLLKWFRKNKHFQWVLDCENAFKQFKEFLTTLPILTRPKSEGSILVYLCIVDQAINVVLVQERNQEQKSVWLVSKEMSELS